MISAPMPRLKRLQYWILENILNQIRLHEAANGFVAKRSILSNAQPHVGKAIVINLDLKDFFPTVTYSRIRGVFKLRQGSQQEVTGLIVNDKISINRKKIKQFRALLFQIEKDGLEGKEWAGIKEPKHLLNSIQGYANFINMVNPEKGKLFKQQIKGILKTQGKNS